MGDNRATVIIRQSAPGTRYDVRFGGSVVASFTANVERPESITTIAANIATTLHKLTGYEASTDGNLIRIRRTGSGKMPTVQASPVAFSTAYRDTVAKFTDLPPNEVAGRLVRVAPDPGNDASAYYVTYNATTGRWEETIRPGISTRLDASTMPMILTWEKAYGVWWCRPEVWSARTIGDTESNPDPSFVGRSIESLFFVSNRMCLLSDENVIFSEESGYTNFFRTSAAQLLDSDRIDIAAQAASNRVAYLRHAIPFEGGLAVFADTAQFRIEYPEGLSPNTISIRPLSEYDCARSVRPQRLGRNIVFASEQSGEKWSTIREFFIESLNGEPDASSLTEAIPEYIPAGIGKIATSSTLNHAAVFTRGNRRRLYFYSFHWVNNTRVQSAWNWWEIPNTQFLNGEFFGKTLFLLTVRDDILTLSTMLLEEDLKGDAFGVGVLLDNLCTHKQVTVSRSGNSTLLAMPYTPLPGERLVCVLTKDGVDRRGTQYEVTPRGHSHYEVHDVDLTGQSFVVGTRFAFEFEVSPVYARNEQGVPLQDGRLQLRSTSILCNTASAFAVHVQLQGRKDYVTDYSGITLGSHESLVGYVPGDDGEFRVATPGEPEKMRILIRNDTAYPSRFNAIEWTGIWRPQTNRRR